MDIKKAAREQRKARIAAESERTARLRREVPERPPEPDTLAGPGRQQEAKGESDAHNKAQRRTEH